MSEVRRQSAKSLESRYTQVFKYLYVALACVLVGAGMMFLYMNQLKSNEQVAITNAQTQANAAKDSNICKIYPTEDQCQLANKIAANPTAPVNGKDGADGSDGATGPTGATGAKGTSGATGATGKGISNVELNASGHLIISYTDDTHKDVGRVVGATGPAGANGKPGLTGIAGASGASGPAGATGASGTDGSPGRGVTSSVITNGHLIITYTDGTADDAGLVTGPASPDKFVTAINVDSAGNIDVSYNNGPATSIGKLVFPATVSSISCTAANGLTLTMTDGKLITAPNVVCTP